MGVKISELNEASSVQNSDVLPIVQNGETKKIQVETLGSQKVNKSGDTLTGYLDFENKDEFHALIKTRTVNGTDCQVAVGVGANNSARMEYIQNNNVLSSIEARSDGIYNGKKNSKLVETAHMTWGTSFSFPLEGGHQALIMGASSQLAIAWLGGNPPSLNFTRIAGNELNATYDGTNVTVTHGNGSSFTCGVIIV